MKTSVEKMADLSMETMTSVTDDNIKYCQILTNTAREVINVTADDWYY